MSTPSPPPSPPSDSNPDTPASPLPPPSTVVALAATSAAALSSKKPLPVLWSREETLFLIEAYKEKWYSMNRGQLKAAHWEEIAVTVSARSGGGFDRSATQCRHKIEKMRKRFRSERQRVGPASIWPYYGFMDELDRNPTPISARPITRLPPYREEEDGEDEEDEEEDEAEEDDENGRSSKSRSINYILRRPSSVNRFAGDSSSRSYGVGDFYSANSGFAQTRKRKLEEVGEGKEERERMMGLELAAEIKGFAERMMEMEKRKMEVMRETARRRIEMENKRIQMIKNSQKKVVDLIAKAFENDSPKVEQEA